MPRIDNEPTRSSSTPSTSPSSGVSPSSDVNRTGSTTPESSRTGFEGASSTSSTQPSSANVGVNLQNHVAGGGVLQRGAEGVEVREMQQLLNRAGASLSADGKYGPNTENAVRDFQRSNGLATDGKFGPASFKALREQTGATPARPSHPTTPAAPSTPHNSNFVTGEGRVNSGFATTRAERQRQAEDLLKANGAWPPEDGRAYAIQIDQDNPPASASRSARRDYVRSYTGQTAVFRAENGRLIEEQGPMKSASHPGQFSTNGRGTPNVGGDRKRDIAHIRPGAYNYHTRTNGSGRFNPTNNGQFRVARDTNQDGVIDGRETSGDYSATGIQIHVGRSDRPSSVGCQTMPPQDYDRFKKAIRSANYGGNSDFTYILARRPNDRYGANPF